MRRNKQVTNNKQKRRSEQDRAISHPPQLNGYQITHSVVMRYIVKTALTSPGDQITATQLLNSWILAVSSTAGFNLFDTVKVKRVEVWALPVIGGATTIDLKFSGATGPSQGDELVHTDTSMGIQPAHVRARPSARSLASNFQDVASGGLFTLTCPVGSVIDVHCVFRSTWDTAPVACTNALVGAQQGDIMLRGLDGLATAASKFTVVGGNQV